MNNAISEQPPQVVAECISKEGQSLLSHWDENPNQYEKNSYKIHALIYKAIELHLTEYPEIKNVIHKAICEVNLYKKGRLDTYFYISEHPGLTNYPSAEEMEIELCR
jgi:hypothetical protein